MSTHEQLTVVRVASNDESSGLAAYLDRVVALDPAASVRLQAQGAVLGVWSGPPMDVVALRPVALAEPMTLDLTVGAARLRDVVTASIGSRGFGLPSTVPGAPWGGLLPPRTGWQHVSDADVVDVVAAVENAVVEFRELTELVDQAARDRTTLQAYADEVWARPVVADLPLRVAHAANLLGLLGRDGRVVLHEAGGWQRLACPGGSVAHRRAAGGLGLLLGGLS